MLSNRAFHGQKEDESWQVAALVAVLLVFSPLIKGGNAPIPLLVLELLSLLLLARLVFVPAFRWHLSGWGMAVLSAAVLLPLLYLIPIPIELWGALPGREPYADLIRDSQGGSALAGVRALSISPFETKQGWLALLFPLAIFLVTVGLPERRIRTLVRVFLYMAVFQALLGLVQFIQGPESHFRLGNPFYLESAVGTYVNRNHLAGVLYLALPVGIAFFVVRSMGEFGNEQRRRRSAADSAMRLLAGLIPIILLTGLFFTRSRAGIALGVLGFLLTALIFSIRIGRRKLLLLIAAVFFIGIFAAFMTGFGPVIARYASLDTIENGRWEIFSSALEAARTFFPIGAGPSTFAELFPLFQPGDMSGFVNRVHNDYLELYFDGGLLLLIPALFLLLWYLMHWRTIWGGGNWQQFRVLQAGAGVGIFLMLLHSLVDFNLHIPANVGYFAFLAGIFFHPGGTASAKRGRSAETGSGAKTAAQPQQRSIPEENKVNPFATQSAGEDSA